MYKPPPSSNRVKFIKNKFENIDNKTDTTANEAISNGTRHNLNDKILTNTKQVLSRQLSDPLKRNIKRTPAFRLDNSSKFERNCANRSSLFENKVKQFSALKTNCDTNSNFPEEKSDLNGKCDRPALPKPIRSDKSKPVGNGKSNLSDNAVRTLPIPELRRLNLSADDNKIVAPKPRPVLLKSKSSHDFALIRSKFDKSAEYRNKVIVDLYTEPIPKALRVKNETCYNNKSTLKLSDKKELTDTLKTALKKPLPVGPAPKKPPRTFQHSQNHHQKNESFLHLHLTKQTEIQLTAVKSSKPKADHKYMLNKLETALRNNKLRTKRQVAADISTTSGEDSDDSLLFRSKSTRTLPRLPIKEDSATDLSSLNCLNSIVKCTNSPYAAIKEPSSSFFVDRAVEPVYAEPFQFRSKTESQIRDRNIRNSLHYMSSPVVGEPSGLEVLNDIKDNAVKMQEVCDSVTNFHKTQISAESSSLSSFTSDLDSPSPMDELKMKNIIESFEANAAIQSGDDRIETLKSRLQNTLNNSFRDNTNGFTDIVSKFQNYIKSVPKYSQPNVNRDTLFYCCLVVERVKNISQIKFKFPYNAHIPANIEYLCFPEDEKVVLNSTNNCYSLSITNDKGERTYGYCRRVLPEGFPICLPLVYCILSKYKAPRFYKQILIELESRHGIKNRCRDELITQFYNQKFPKPGESIKVNLKNLIEPIMQCENDLEDSMDLTSFVHINKRGEYGSVKKVHHQVFLNAVDVADSCDAPSLIVEDNERMELILTLHKDMLFENADLNRLHKLPGDVLLKIFSSLLIERKVILISSVLSDLSCCVDSLQSILNPFTWPHPFISVLPEALWETVESPTPIICGCLSVDVLKDHKIENGIVVDLDSGVVLLEEGDELKIMSSSMQKAWRKCMAFANKSVASGDYIRSVYLRQAYLQVFRLCLNDFQKYVINGRLQKSELIKNGKTKGIRQFLKMFTETTMFIAFEESIADNSQSIVDFDVRFNINDADNYDKILDKLFEWKR